MEVLFFLLIPNVEILQFINKKILSYKLELDYVNFEMK